MLNRKVQDLPGQFPVLFENGNTWIECADGWYTLLLATFAKLENHIRSREWPNDKPRVAQFKEKFGCLRLYFDNEDEEMRSIISSAERLSGTVCENCGSLDGAAWDNGGWISTVCKDCKRKIEESQVD